MRPLKELKQAQNTTFRKLKKDYDTNKFNFIIAELELAATFAETAAASRSEKRNRNAAKARKAYEAAQKFLKTARITPEMAKIVAEKMAPLRSLMPQINASISTKPSKSSRGPE
jgi:hypothetical protein